MQGIIKGLGVQEGAQSAALFCFCCICIPCAYLFGFKLEMGLPGMWYGYSIGILVLNLMYGYLIVTDSDWDAISKRVQEEMQEEEQDLT